MSYKKKSCLGLSFALLNPKYLLLQDFARKVQGLQDDEISSVKAVGMWVIEVSLAHDCILGTATGATHGKFNSSYKGP